jgi:hypothetical protein
VNVSDEEAKMGGPVDTGDILSVVARAYMTPNYFSATWWRCISIAASLAISPYGANIGTERGWLSRWQGKGETGTAAISRMHSVAELRTFWEGVCDGMNQFLATLDDQKLQETLSTTARTGSYTASYGQMIQHVVDHSSYHRGQIVTMLRQLGVTPLSTGLIRFYRDGPASQ